MDIHYVPPTPHHAPRAERHAVSLPVRYRLARDKSWCDGLTENLSASGVLFRVAREIPVGARMQILMDFRFRSEKRIRVVSRAVVVRVVHSPASAHKWSVAAKLEMQEFRSDSP